jgi:REP element-mobilizing transposase RayT
VFSTKDQKPTLLNIQTDLYSYISAIFRNIECPIIAVGGAADHIHILFCLSREKSLSDIVQMVKVSTTRWIKAKHQPQFAWQKGYGAFSVSQSGVSEVHAYITNQEKHHEEISFQEEFVDFLKRHQVAYDPKVWS